MPPPTLVDTEHICRSDAGALRFEQDHHHRSIPVAESGSWWRRLLGFMGPGYLVAVGYMDPGNWATDLAGGAAFGHRLLWIVMLSNLMAVLLQILSARLGIVTGMDLAQACRQRYSRRSATLQWLMCEIAICATDLAEVIGTAIALKLLFGLPLAWGVTVTVLDVLLVLWLQQRGFRYLEAMIIALLGVIFICIGFNLILSHPAWHEVAAGFVPSGQIAGDPKMLYLAIGIIGATVMPHNLYLHSSTVQTRRFTRSDSGRSNALKFAAIDVCIALSFAFLINAAILVTAASAFHDSGHRDLVDIQDAYHLLTPLLGTTVASFLFGLALLACGQSSTLTATLAGQIVMEGYLKIRLPAWLRRLSTRALAILPALFVTVFHGDAGVASLLVFSQVVLSLQLPFAIVPLIRLTSDRKCMGKFVNPPWVTGLAWLVAAIIIVLNAALLQTVLST